QRFFDCVLVSKQTRTPLRMTGGWKLKTRGGNFGVLSLIFVWLLFFAIPALAQQPLITAAMPTPAPISINIGMPGGSEQGNVSTAIQIVFVMTLLTLAPSIMMLMTSFTRIVIVLGFVRTALGVQGAPSNQIIIGISLFL